MGEVGMATTKMESERELLRPTACPCARWGVAVVAEQN